MGYLYHNNFVGINILIYIYIYTYICVYTDILLSTLIIKYCN